MPHRVIVVGSVNVDLVTRVAHLPGPGETVSGGTFEQHHGGKGANQAVAARRLGAAVEFVGAIGADAFGAAALAALRAEGVGTAELRTVAGAATGVAVIMVDASGENMIAVAPGANASVGPAEVRAALARLAVAADDIVLVSHEIRTAAAHVALAAARDAGARSIFNPAPATGLDRSTFGLADLLVPNRSELAMLATEEGRRVGRPGAGADTAERQARALLESSPEGEGPRIGVVVTLGPAGALIVQRAGSSTTAVEIPAQEVRALDTTGAGDTFCGALAAALAEGRGLAEAVRRSVRAAAIATTRVGAREGMPTVAELQADPLDAGDAADATDPAVSAGR